PGRGRATLSSTPPATTATCGATFSGLRIDNAADTKTLPFAKSGPTRDASRSFTVSPAAAAKLVVTTQPAGAVAGHAFTTQPQVTVEDQFGNLETGDNGTAVNVALGGTGTLRGTVSATASGGVATFAGLRVDTTG